MPVEGGGGDMCPTTSMLVNAGNTGKEAGCSSRQRWRRRRRQWQHAVPHLRHKVLRLPLGRSGLGKEAQVGRKDRRPLLLLLFFGCRLAPCLPAPLASAPARALLSATLLAVALLLLVNGPQDRVELRLDELGRHRADGTMKWDWSVQDAPSRLAPTPSPQHRHASSRAGERAAASLHVPRGISPLPVGPVACCSDHCKG